MLNNPWVIGIGTGIIVWIVTFMVSRFLLSKRENREYAQKISAANREVIVAIRPGVAEGNVPAPEVIDAMIKSTARRYNVTATDMYNGQEICEELVKEVMDSSFLSSAQKTEYCKKLIPIRSGSLVNEQEKAMEKKDVSATAARYRDRMTSMLSSMISMLAGIMTVFMAIPVFRGQLGKDGLSKDLDNTLTILLPALITLSMVMAMFLYREVRARRRTQAMIDESTKELEGLSAKITSNLKTIK